MPLELAHHVLSAAPLAGPAGGRGFSHGTRTPHGGHAAPEARSLSGRHSELLEPAAGLS
jgi:hypothetical protein